MKLLQRSDIDGLIVFQGKIHNDHRGNFEELGHKEALRKLGIPHFFPQENISTSRKGVLRGLHFQDPRPQGRLIKPIKGSIYDVCLDLRPDSFTFRGWDAVILDAAQSHSCFIPEGCAHGYLAIEDSVILYKCSDLYDVESDRGIHYADPELGIPWQLFLFGAEPIMSEKDLKLPTMSEYLRGK